MNNSLRRIIYTGVLIAIGVILSEILSIDIPPGSQPIIKISFGSIPIILVSIFFGPLFGGVAGIIQDLLGYVLFGLAKGYVFHPGFILNSFLMGLIPGFVFYKFKKSERNFNTNTLFMYANIAFVGVFSALGLNYLTKVEKIGKVILDENLRLILFILIIISSVVLIVFSFYTHYKSKKEEVFSMNKVLFAVMVPSFITSIILTPIWLKQLYGLDILIQMPVRLIKYPIELIFAVFVTYALLKTLKVFIFDLTDKKNI